MSEVVVNFYGQTSSRLRNNDPFIDAIDIAGERDLQEICAAVQDNSNVKLFQIRRSAIDQPAADAISNAIAKMPLLKWFTLAGCNCGEIKVFRALASSLANKDSLEMLDIRRCNKFGDSGAKVVVASFRRNLHLQYLYLPNCDIGVEGAIAIASLISNNNSLKGADLRCNKIRREGAIALAQSISQNKNLEELCFINNFSEEDYCDICKALKKALYNDETIETVMGSNHTLTRMDFEGDDAIWSLLEFNRAGPEKSRRSKVIKFLNDKPMSLLSMNFEKTLMPTVLDKIGRDCQPNAMFELVRNMPDIFDSPRTPPY